MAGTPPPTPPPAPQLLCLSGATLRSLGQQSRGRGTRRAGLSAEEEELSRTSSQRQGTKKQTGRIRLNDARRVWIPAAH